MKECKICTCENILKEAKDRRQSLLDAVIDFLDDNTDIDEKTLDYLRLLEIED